MCVWGGYGGGGEGWTGDYKQKKFQLERSYGLGEGTGEEGVKGGKGGRLREVKSKGDS